MSRLLTSFVAFALAFTIASWDFMIAGVHHRISADQLDRMSGLNGEYFDSENLTDCAEAQSEFPEGRIPASHCWNFDEAVAEEPCFFCQNDNLYSNPKPWPTGGTSQVEGDPDSCAGDLYHGNCLDPDGNGNYKCLYPPGQEEPDGDCTGEIQDWLSQQIVNP